MCFTMQKFAELYGTPIQCYETFQMGYAKIDQKGQGLHLRTFSRAFIIDDGQERFVFVTVDSAMVGHDLRLAVRLLLCIQFAL